MTAVHGHPASLRGPIVTSALLHVLVVGGLAVRTATKAPPLPPMYRVQLLAAPPGPRAEGAVTDRPSVAEAPAPAAAELKSQPTSKVAAKRAARPPKAATPNPTATTKAPPKAVAQAGGGPEGGRGADVANVSTVGIEFPYPAYLQNIVRQIALQFEAPRGGSVLRAEVAFLVHRDGSVSGIRLVTRSGSYVFDLTCVGAVEAAGRSGRFGPLPQGFTDDVLPVIFSFDPTRM